jgi:probable F420-dependent oxidoreductase
MTIAWGAHLPHLGRQATPDNIRTWVSTCERIGMHSVWTSDHIAWPRTIESQYPYSDNGEFPPSDGIPWLDPLGTLFFAAALSDRLLLGTTVLILGHRPVVPTAKAWASLDALSGGRVLLGVGVGWMREEFDAIQMPFDHRGARADEQLAAYEQLFGTDWPSFNGTYTKFPEIGFFPRPAAGRIPVWVGGDSAPAYRRTARFGEVFHAAFQTEDQLREHRDGVRRACEEVGRDPGAVGFSVRVYLDLDGTAAPAKSLVGSAAQMIETASRLRDLGYNHILLDPTGRGGSARRLEGIEHVMAEVASALS